MIRIIIFSFFTLLLVSCKRSDEQIIASAEKTLFRFVDELKLQNFESANLIYPNLLELRTYRVINELRITRTDIQNNQVKVFAEYLGPTHDVNYRPIQFTLEEIEEDKWVIINSKGLNSIMYQDVFQVAKRSGCLTNIESDLQIEKDCVNLEKKIKDLVDQIKESIESSVVFENKGSNLMRDYGYISGDVTVKNLSNLTIPSFSYTLFLVFHDRNGEIIHAEEIPSAYSEIYAKQLHQFHIISTRSNRNYSSYTTIIKLNNTGFIRDYVIKNEVVSCF